MCHCMKCNANVLVDSASIVQPCPTCNQYGCPHTKDHTYPCNIRGMIPVETPVIREVMWDNIPHDPTETVVLKG